MSEQFKRDDADDVLEWLNRDGEQQDSLRLAIEFGVIGFDGTRFWLTENWEQGMAAARKACCGF